MKTVEETRRELFEAWAKNGCGRLSRENSPDCDPHGYQDSHTDLCWHAFNAALDAVEIELPSGFETFGEYSQEAARIATECCAEAIESTNLGIKVK